MNKWLQLSVTLLLSGFVSLSATAKMVIAIDAGHGGKDPGAIGRVSGIQEKEITLSIARELKALVNADPNFKAVMIRDKDQAVPVQNRSEIARKNKATYLISIHADISPLSEKIKGSSVWVLSNGRANDELTLWLENNEKQSELLGGSASVLTGSKEPYLDQAVLDLQFSHSRRTSYELGKSVLEKLSRVTPLAKKTPQHASLSVLRSPDITSILVETGFLSNPEDEQRLASASYRRQLANAIYQGLVDYANKTARYTKPKTVYKSDKSIEKEEKKSEVKSDLKSNNIEKNSTEKNNKEKNSTASSKKTENTKAGKTQQDDKNRTNGAKQADKNQEKTVKTVDPNAAYHVVAQDETLYSIARMYKTTPEKLSKLNNIKDNKIIVGKKLKLK